VETPVVPGLPAAPVAEPAAVPVDTAAHPAAVSSQAPILATPRTTEPPPAAGAGPAAIPSRSREEWEAIIGGKLLNRIGAVALILGVGFFLKYAFDNNWISEAVRVLIGAVAGGVCLLGAERSRRRGYQIFSQGLVGAGVAILYTAVFAAFNFYALVSQPAAYMMMSAVTVIACLHAFRYDSQVVGLLSLFGGFLTPYLLATETTIISGLLGYVLLLDAGIVVVALRRQTWVWLEPLAILGTYVVFFTWFVPSRPDPGTAVGLLFVSLAGAMFHGIDLRRLSRGAMDAFDLRRLVAIAHSVLLFAALMTVLDPLSDRSKSLAAILLAGLYAGSAWLGKSHPVRGSFLFGEFIITAIALVLIAAGIEFEKFTLMIVWAALCAGFGWWGLRSGRASVWVSAVAFLPIVFLGLLATPGALAYEPLESFRPLWNERALAFAALAVALGVVGSSYRRQSAAPRWGLDEAFPYGWLTVLLLGLSVEILDLFRLWAVGQPDGVRQHLAFQRLLALSLVWLVVALPLAWRGLRTGRRPLFYGPLWVVFVAALACSVRSLWYVPIEEFHPVVNLRVGALLIMAGGLSFLARLLARHAKAFEWVADFRSPAQVVGILLLLVLVSSEAWDYFRMEMLLAEMDGEARLGELRNLQQLSLSAVWLVFSLALMGTGLWKRNRWMRVQSIVIFGVAILKIFAYDLSFLETLYRIFSFVGLGIILLGVSYLYQRYRHVIMGERTHPSPD
jgi:uncharacterized membrane protein